MPLEDANTEGREVVSEPFDDREEVTSRERLRSLREARTDLRSGPPVRPRYGSDRSGRGIENDEETEEAPPYRKPSPVGYGFDEKEATDPREGPSGVGRALAGSVTVSPVDSDGFVSVRDCAENDTDPTENSASALPPICDCLMRYGSRLEWYGDRSGRMDAQPEPDSERYGPAPDVDGRRPVGTGPRVGGTTAGDRRRGGGLPNTSFQTQTESGNEGFAQQSADSCQGSVVTSRTRQGRWNDRNTNRRLTRRPPFQFDDGSTRPGVRRRNADTRDVAPLNRFREERRRSVWRNDNDIREYRRIRAAWRHHFFYHRYLERGGGVESDGNAPDGAERLRSNDERDNGGLIRQDHVRISRDRSLYVDDPRYGFVIVDESDSAGPSWEDTSRHAARRPRSNMSLRPLNVFSPPRLGGVTEYNAESDEDDTGPDLVGRYVHV